MNNIEAKTILGTTLGSFSLEVLKRLFRKQILQWHPDIAVNRGISHQAATAKSQRIILAYEILSDNLESLEDNSFKYSYETYYRHKTSNTKNYKHYYGYNVDSIDESFINRITVKSSNVKWIDYIIDLEVLVVRFKNSSIYYLYYDVPESVFFKFQRADSPGKFVHEYLKGYKYDSHSEYAEWLNIYKSLSEITEDKKKDI